MGIPVILVDDDKLDRYITRRQLAKIDTFGPMMEMHSGDNFLDTCFRNSSYHFTEDSPALVLMDINMPGSNGFETIEKAEEEINRGKGSANLLFVILTSSNSSIDREKASTQNLVKGFLSKPIDREGAAGIRDLYIAVTGRSL